MGKGVSQWGKSRSGCSCRVFVLRSIRSHASWFFFLILLRSFFLAWLNIYTTVKVTICVQVWQWAVWVRRWACFNWLSLESVYRGSTWRLQPSLPIVICSTSSTTFNQVRHLQFQSNLSQCNLIQSNCLGSSTLVTRSNTLPSRRTLKNSRLVCKKDDVHVCVMCLRAIMNYQVKFKCPIYTLNCKKKRI